MVAKLRIQLWSIMFSLGTSIGGSLGINAHVRLGYAAKAEEQ